MSFQPSVNIAQLRESATIAVSARAKALRAEGRQVIDLGAGEPDFPTPGYVMDAARRALEAGLTRYTQVEGILPLREVIAERATAHRPGTRFDPAAVVVSAGTKQALFNACFTLFGPGDEVLVPTPGWTSYYEMVGLARAVAIPVCGSPDAQFKITPRGPLESGDVAHARVDSQLALQSHRRRVFARRARPRSPGSPTRGGGGF